MTHQSKWLRVSWACLLAACSSGCHFAYPGRLPDGPLANVAPQTPRELSKVSLPDYIIEPPDILTIEAVSLLPKQPYVLRPMDVVAITSQGLVPEETNLVGQFVVQADGAMD